MLDSPYQVGDSISTISFKEGKQVWVVQDIYLAYSEAEVGDRGVMVRFTKAPEFVPGLYQKYKNGKPLVNWGTIEIRQMNEPTDMISLVEGYTWVRVNVTAAEDAS